MIDKGQTLIATWSVSNKEHYEKRGYKFTKYKDKFEVKVEDVPDSSNMLVKMICDNCGEIKDVRYQHYKKSKSYPLYFCKHCGKTYNLEERQNKMYDVVTNFCNTHNYTLLTGKTELINNHSKVKYICPAHGERTTSYSSIYLNHQCYLCGRADSLKKKAITTLQERRCKLYTDAIEACELKGYEYLSDVADVSKNTDYIYYKCPKHGIHSMRISNLISGKGCPECACDDNRSNNQLSSDEVVSRIQAYGGNIINPEEYINKVQKNLEITCPRCGAIFSTSLRNFCQHEGQYCEKCSKIMSKGEHVIKQCLEKYDVQFIQEKWFADCRDINPLPFDFYLPTRNECIEFDGEQHYYDKGNFSNSLEYVKRHDSIKNQYCKDKGIKLLRIPYWDLENIEQILVKELNLHKDIV